MVFTIPRNKFKPFFSFASCVLVVEMTTKCVRDMD